MCSSGFTVRFEGLRGFRLTTKRANKRNESKQKPPERLCRNTFKLKWRRKRSLHGPDSLRYFMLCSIFINKPGGLQFFFRCIYCHSRLPLKMSNFHRRALFSPHYKDITIDIYSQYGPAFIFIVIFPFFPKDDKTLVRRKTQEE